MRELYIVLVLIGATYSLFFLWFEHRKEARYKKQKDWLENNRWLDEK